MEYMPQATGYEVKFQKPGKRRLTGLSETFETIFLVENWGLLRTSKNNFEPKSDSPQVLRTTSPGIA